MGEKKINFGWLDKLDKFYESTYFKNFGSVWTPWNKERKYNLIKDMLCVNP